MHSGPVDATDVYATKGLQDDYALLDALPDEGYRDIAKLASVLCGTPSAYVSLIEGSHQWFKAGLGLHFEEHNDPDTFCARTIALGRTLVVPDARLDPDLSRHPLVVGAPHVRFYAGTPILSLRGEAVGTVCVLDLEPHTLSPAHLEALEALARRIVSMLEQSQAVAMQAAAAELARRAAQSLSEAHDAVRAAEERTRLAQTAGNIVTWDWNIADDRVIWSDNVKMIYGKPAEEIATIDRVFDCLLPEDRDALSRDIVAADQDGARFDTEFRVRWPDNSIHFIVGQGVAFANATGMIVRLIGVNRDTTRERSAERARRRMTAQLEHVLGATADGVAIVDRLWSFAYLNDSARRIMRTGTDPLGANIWEAFPAMIFEGSPFVEYYHRAMDEGLPGEFETEYLLPNPVKLLVFVRAMPDGIILLFRDVTEERTRTQALMQTEKLAAVGRLASSIAHEINNPLESVTNLLYLARTAEQVAETQEYLTMADTELRRVASITSQTLRFHRQSSQPVAVSCENLLESTLGIYQARLTNSRVEIERRYRALAQVLCFDGEIRQVLNNLVGNALDAMSGKGGRLLLRSREGTHWKTGARGVALTVADTGPGMPPQVMRRIFEAFYTTKGAAGTGLGLWISAETVQRHCGELRVRSRATLATGTVFTLFLPFDAATR